MPMLQETIRDCRLKSQSVTNSQRSLQHELHENLTTSIVGPERPVETQIAASIATTDACRSRFILGAGRCDRSRLR